MRPPCGSVIVAVVKVGEVRVFMVERLMNVAMTVASDNRRRVWMKVVGVVVAVFMLMFERLVMMKVAV